MNTDDSGMSDEIIVELNPASDPVAEAEAATKAAARALTARPADKDPKSDWVRYCVALGASESYLAAETVHYDPKLDAEVLARGDQPSQAGKYSVPALTKEELIKLADHLGG